MPAWLSRHLKSTILCALIAVPALCGGACATDFSLLAGLTAASEENVGAGLHAAARVEPYLGKHLWIDFSPSFDHFTNSFYLVEFPVVVSGSIRLAPSRNLRIGGGIGVAFSDLPQWQRENRAVTARFTFRYFDDNFFDSRLVPELVANGSATSTGNTLFVTFRLGYRL